MSHIAYLSAQAEYDAREPQETATIVRVSARTTLGELQRMIDDHGVTGLAMRIGGGRLAINAETADADGDGCVPMSRPCPLADALTDAMSAAVVAQREVDAAVGS